ncbi:unnamed protein product [Penicillium bialowiezense]
MTDSNEEGIGRHRRMLAVWQRTQHSHEQRPKNARGQENVRAWERECESEQDGVYRKPYLPSERGTVAPVAALLRQDPVLARTRPDTVWGAQDRRTVTSRPCGSKSGVKTGLDMKEVCPDARDAQQHDPVMSGSEILCSTK